MEAWGRNEETKVRRDGQDGSENYREGRVARGTRRYTDGAPGTEARDSLERDSQLGSRIFLWRALCFQ